MRGQRLPGRLLGGVLALLVVLSGVVSLNPRSASAQELNTFYFPFVPNGDVINNQGPWYGKVSFQNLSDDICAVSIYVARAGSWIKNAQLSVTGGSARSISASSLGIPDPGAPVRLEAACAVMANVKVVTPDVHNSPWSDGAAVVTGYTGLSEMDVAASLVEANRSVWYLPIVQTNSDWNSVIKVTNLALNSSIDVTVRLFPFDNLAASLGADLTVQRTLQIGTSADIDVLAELGEAGWVGFAEIEATGRAAALVHRSKPGARMALTNVAMSGYESAAGRYVLAAPLLFTAYNGWNTGINLANVSDDWATVTIRYFETAGGMVRSDEILMAPYTMQYIYTPGNVPQPDFVGSAMIESDRPLAAAIDEVKYETTEAISYVASTVGQQDAAIPVTFREDPTNGHHDNSGINIQNLNPDAPQTVSIRLVTSTGEDVLDQPFLLTMPPGGNNYLYLPNLDEVPRGTVAAARITSSDEYGFVALSNDVNYAVSGDGSVTFMAAGEAGYYRLLEAPAP